MFGTCSNFKCPCCGHTEVVRLFKTQFVDIKDKGEHLALINCPECNKLIAFDMVGDKKEPSISFDIRSINEDEIENAGVIFY